MDVAPRFDMSEKGNFDYMNIICSVAIDETRRLMIAHALPLYHDVEQLVYISG